MVTMSFLQCASGLVPLRPYDLWVGVLLNFSIDESREVGFAYDTRHFLESSKLETSGSYSLLSMVG